MYNRLCYTTARLTRHRVHAHVDERLQCKEESKGRDMGGDRRDRRRKHAGTNEQIFCSSTKVNPTHGPSAPPQHRPPCSSCPTSVRTPRATSAQRERRRGNRRAVRGLEKASRNRRTEALKPRQSTIGAPRWAKIRTMPFIWQATAATRVQEERQGARATLNQNSVLNRFKVRQRSKGTAKQTVSRRQKVCVRGALQSEGFGDV